MNKVDVTVLLVTLPQRFEMLARAHASIEAQKVKPAKILAITGKREPSRAPQSLAECRNRALARAKTEWVAVFDDDDIYLPDHFEKIAPFLTDQVDIVHTYCDVYRCEDAASMPREELIEKLERTNVLTSNAAIRTEFARELGGWGGPFDESSGMFTNTGVWSDDWDFWLRAARAGARFALVPEVTWSYQLHDDQSSRLWMARHGR